ncbi:MAG: hypothetical protein LDLANPLL_02927 [Turneriella sp.]|nr:hypothetical protein [Turneriella sp.]
MLCLVSLLLLLPNSWRLQAFLPGGAGVFLYIASIWVLTINPQNSIVKLLAIPLPTKAELKAEIEKAPDTEGRLQKYFVLTQQLKKIWEKRDAFLSKANSVLLLYLTITSACISFAVAAYDYVNIGALKSTLTEIETQMNAKLTEAGLDKIDIQKQIIEIAPALLFISSFFSVFFIGAFMRFFARLKFKQNFIHGQLSLFRLADWLVWPLIICGGIFVLGLKQPQFLPLTVIAKNLLWIILFLYTLQGIGIVSLFFEVRLLPTQWLTFGVLVLGILVPGLILVFGAIFVVIGLMEVWLSLRKRALRVVQVL